MSASPRKRSFTRPGVFSETSYVSIGDPYLDGRTASGPASGVVGSVTNRTGESKASFFPPRLCWGVSCSLVSVQARVQQNRLTAAPAMQGAPPGAMTRRAVGIDADTWRSNSRRTLPSPGRSKLLSSTGLLNGQHDRSPRLPMVFVPSSPGKSASHCQSASQ
jgi:hypothetical protein